MLLEEIPDELIVGRFLLLSLRLPLAPGLFGLHKPDTRQPRVSLVAAPFLALYPYLSLGRLHAETSASRRMK